MRRGTYPEARLSDHVDRLGHDHPPIDVASVDFTVRRPAELERRFGHVLDYMARVELGGRPQRPGADDAPARPA